MVLPPNATFPPLAEKQGRLSPSQCAANRCLWGGVQQGKGQTCETRTCADMKRKGGRGVFLSLLVLVKSGRGARSSSLMIFKCPARRGELGKRREASLGPFFLLSFVLLLCREFVPYRRQVFASHSK